MIDDEKQHHRMTSFFTRTAPELVDRVELYEGDDLFESSGVNEVLQPDALAPRRPAARRLPDDRPRRGADGDRRQHRQLHGPRQGLARGHDRQDEPPGRGGGRAPAAAARHRRHHRHRLHRHGVHAQPRQGAGGAAQGARRRSHPHARGRDLTARAGRDDPPERVRGRARDHEQDVPDLRRRRGRALGGDDRDRRRARPAQAGQDVALGGGLPGAGPSARRGDPDRRRRQAAARAGAGDRARSSTSRARRASRSTPTGSPPRAPARRSRSARCRSSRARRS